MNKCLSQKCNIFCVIKNGISVFRDLRKKITATATVTNVENYVKLTDDQIVELFKKHHSKLQLDEKQIKRWHKKCLIFVEFENFQNIEPLDFDHQSNMDDWLIIEKIDDVVVGTSIPYNYEKSRF